MSARLLVVDDDASFRKILEYNLTQEGYEVDVVTNADEALGLLDANAYPLVLTDIKMPGMDGMDLLRCIKERSPDTEVIIITAFGTIEMAVEAMKKGAYEYVTKPFNRDELKIVLANALKLRTLADENSRLRKEVKSRFGMENIIGESEAMQRVFRLIEKVSNTDAPVLVMGESGTGKELVAKALHYRSERSDKPFVAINCAAIPKELLESELFGHVKGAFTGAIKDKKGKFAEADGGTLFLDEIGELSIDLQAKLLRALQEMEITPVGSNEVKKVDVRVISATNRELEDYVEEGNFREDLFYRLAVVPIRVPSLRDRKDDIGILIKHFLAKFAPSTAIKFDKKAAEALMGYRWKGNVRELENTLERLLILRESDTISYDELPAKIKKDAEDAGGKPKIEFPLEGMSLEAAEKSIILGALETAKWNKSKAARLLQVPRHVLLYRMEKFGITSG